MPDTEVVAELSKRLDAIIQGLGALRANLRDMRREMQAGDAALRQEMQNYFRWTITTMVALFAVAVPIWIGVNAFVLQRLLR
jgi:hypothetical protein